MLLKRGIIDKDPLTFIAQLHIPVIILTLHNLDLRDFHEYIQK